MLKIRRAWNGRLNHLNDLLSWMYEEDILNKTEKAKKDRTFRAYYRYYNDGDTPRGFKHVDKERTEEYLENTVNELIAELLKKKQGKYNRADFRKAQHNAQLRQMIRQAENAECHSLLTYFAPKFKLQSTTAYKLFNMHRIEKQYNDVKNEVNKLIDSIDQTALDSWKRITYNHVMHYQLEQLGDKVTPSIDIKVCVLGAACIALAEEMKTKLR